MRGDTSSCAIRRFLVAVLLCFGVVGGATAGAKLDDPTVSLAFVGDIMLDGIPGDTVKGERDPFAHFARILDAADIRIGNLECVIASEGRAERKPFTFRADPRTVNVLKGHFTALSLANNHTGDFGRAAFSEMLNLLEVQKLSYFGGGRNLAEAHAPLLIERNGLKIAILGYNEIFPRSFEANHDTPGLAWSEDEQVITDIQNARKVHHADLVIPFMHWGLEHEPHASARQRRLARTMIDAGANAVIGGHPHVTQDIEQYKGSPIFYSLGNFVFDGFKDEDNITGWLIRLEMDRKGVHRWQLYVAHIDHQGIPHPASPKARSCWQRGQRVGAICG
ncbi:CapA family protein [Cupriavidus lacunae]|uniref:CapA family protein n=1 Tax=Cupriavidus lacunae TaxID=2666307 RepID=A0A370NHP0_9BURK|nr:CapA family protein [Cupriavidus lacunae]RDK05095.1 CapA family protein [Cupriavidus lacunae]